MPGIGGRLKGQRDAEPGGREDKERRAGMANGTALLVIDVQVAMFDGDPPHQHDEVLANIRSLIDKARAAKTPVIFVQHEHDRYEPMMRDAPGWQIHPAVAPLPGERIIHKK